MLPLSPCSSIIFLNLAVDHLPSSCPYPAGIGIVVLNVNLHNGASSGILAGNATTAWEGDESC